MIEIEYGEEVVQIRASNGVQGTYEASLPVDGPVVDHNEFWAFLAGLALEEGFRATVDVFELNHRIQSSGSVAVPELDAQISGVHILRPRVFRMELEVVGVTTVGEGAAEESVFRLLAGREGSESRREYLLRREAPHVPRQVGSWRGRSGEPHD